MTRDLTGIARPCPMCGSKRIYLKDFVIDAIYSAEIRCADCGLNGYKNAFGDNAIKEAIIYWNTRADEGGENDKRR